MSAERLRRSLHAVAPPDALAAERRAWAVVRTVYLEREPIRRRRRPRWSLVFVGVAAALAALAGTPAGPAVVGAIRDAVRGGEEARPALSSLPSPGRLLVSTPNGVWVLRADGSKRRLGDYRQASWSPAGKFVVATDGRQVYAVEPDTGEVRWAVPRPRAADARWGPGLGFRVAYRSGATLRVVAGDGMDDRLLAGSVAPVAPAWRPVPAGVSGPYVLAYATRRGSVRVVDVDSRRILWGARVGHVIGLAWSADARRLAVVTPGAVRLFSGGGTRLDGIAAPAGMRIRAGAYAPKGPPLLALLRTDGHAGEAVLVGANGRARVLSRNPGRLAGLAWSADGSRLLVGWPSAGEWLFLPVGGGRPVAVSAVGRDFNGFYPRVAEWCCSR